jgi:hypothetical protein
MSARDLEHSGLADVHFGNFGDDVRRPPRGRLVQ